MKLIIAGSRDICKYRAFYEFGKWATTNEEIVEQVSELVTGVCPTGPDQVPFLFKDMGLIEYAVDIKEFPADWGTHVRAAGPIRNQQMAEYADALVLIWDGNSRGSQNMKYCMKQFDKPVYEIII